MSGPLAGVRVVELVGIGPGPFAAMMLADMGAEVVRVDRADRAGRSGPSLDLLGRGRPSVGLDLKAPGGPEVVLRLVERADALIEGFRPGVAEKLGVGPDPCLERNPKLVYGRMTGWGQEGPLAGAAGHDINYIALAGALDGIGRAGQAPVPPMNLVGDFGGGGMLLAFGIACGLIEAARSGKGQVVDAAMVDGAAIQTTFIHQMRALGMWPGPRGTNLLDSGAPFYDAYQTKDGKYVAVGALEAQFYQELVQRLGLEAEDLPPQMDRSAWPDMKRRFAELFRTRTRQEWCEILEGTDACFAPVLSMEEAAGHPHNRHRGTFVEVDGVPQPAPAPRFSRTPGAVARPPSQPGADTEEALLAWGFSGQEISELRAAGTIS
ncbi:MAG TPA: CaiB/BaiF CoA-transferase family protein [Acidimicrobiales bacterium]|nr:CaiB/BaiF CoA-transferase family protein [Acidimicrobiales bacterium]